MFPSPRRAPVPFALPILPLVAFAAAFAVAPVAIAADKPPVAPVEDVVETHWGVDVHDPYRWMEETEDPKVVEWIHGQADWTSATLDRLPHRQELLDRIAEFDAGRPWRVFSVTLERDGGMFYLRQEAKENLPRLYVPHCFLSFFLGS